MDVHPTLQMAVDLIKHNAHMVQSWVTRFIAVNGALASAVGAILGWSSMQQNEKLVLFVLISICILAIWASFAISGVIQRHLDWNGVYMRRIKELQPIGAPLFTEKAEKGSSLENTARLMPWIVLIPWTILALILLYKLVW
jgi:hypothetical protein